MQTLFNAAGRLAAVALLCLAAAAPAHAGLITYNFDGIDDGTSLTNQYAGLQFTNATVLRAGIGLNEFAFPPFSGDGVVFDDGGAIGITFDAPVQAVTGRFTYGGTLTILAYDSADQLIAAATSQWNSNVADGTGDIGSMTNELLGLTSAGGLISRIVIGTTLGSGSLVLDDLAVTTAAVDVPEPGTLLLVALGLPALLWSGRPRRR